MIVERLYFPICNINKTKRSKIQFYLQELGINKIKKQIYHQAIFTICSTRMYIRLVIEIITKKNSKLQQSNFVKSQNSKELIVFSQAQGMGFYALTLDSNT